MRYKIPPPITLVMDHARYQRCRRVQELALTLNIELQFLPSYSRHPQCFGDFRRAIGTCLDELNTTQRSKIDRLITLNFQSFEMVSMLGG